MALLLKSAYSTVCGFTGVTKKRLTGKRGREYLILMYHRILPEQKKVPGPGGMYVDRNVQEAVGFLKTFSNPHVQGVARFFGVNGGGRPDGILRCLLTFDDGWADFFEYAYPLLREQMAPATVSCRPGSSAQRTDSGRTGSATIRRIGKKGNRSAARA
jgi:hypothetical protein